MKKWSRENKERLQQKNGEHKNIRALLFELAYNKGYVIKPINLIILCNDWLQENRKSTMNAQQARNTAEVYSILCHIYYIAGEVRKAKRAFPVSQSVWNYFSIKQSVLENSIKLLKDMGLLDYYNHCENNDPTRRKRYYILNRQMLEFRIKQFIERYKKPQQDVANEIYFDDWKKCKNLNGKPRRTQIVDYFPAQDPDLNDYEDLNDMFDDGWYFS